MVSFQLKFWKVWFSKKEETICQMNAFGLVFYFAYIFPYFVENHTLQNISLNDTMPSENPILENLVLLQTEIFVEQTEIFGGEN